MTDSRQPTPDAPGEEGPEPRRDFGVEIELGEALNALLSEAAASGIGLDARNRRDLERILAASAPTPEAAGLREEDWTLIGRVVDGWYGKGADGDDWDAMFAMLRDRHNGRLTVARLTEPT